MKFDDDDRRKEFAKKDYPSGRCKEYCAKGLSNAFLSELPLPLFPII